MRCIRLVVEYDGTPFSGWQIQQGQPHVRTIQGELKQALERLVREEVLVKGASRTDAGVHARGQVAAFETSRENIKLVGFERGVRGFLPKEIAVRSAEEVELGYDPRRTSRGKRYIYSIWNDSNPTALDRQRVWHVPAPLNLEAMQEGANRMLGTHDFEAFRAAGCSAKHAVRTMYGMEVRRGPQNRVELVVLGNAFVRNMVRIMAGNLCEVGQGRMKPERISEIIASRDRREGGPTAPPQGLCLEEVIYDDRLPPRPKDDQDVDGED